MEMEMWRGVAYFVTTIFLVIFLYGYIFTLYRRQKKGIEDYERYGYLALNDSLDDEIIDKKKNENRRKG